MKRRELPKIETEFEKFKKLIFENSVFFLAGHINPDGDTIGSMLAIASMLKRLDKKVYLFSQDPIPENLSFMHGISKIKNTLPKAARIDVSILLECSVPNRGGKIKEVLDKSSRIVNIDHHKTAELYGDINILDFASSSTAEIIYRFFYDINLKVNKLEASYLYVGMVTDTGRFHFPATSPRTHDIAARLLQTGFNFSRINDLLYFTKSYESVKMTGRALENLELLNGGTIAAMTLDLKDFSEFSAGNEHTENIINYGMMIPGVKISVLFKEEDGRTGVTFRSKGNIDVSSIAKKFHGGGHKNASGCKIPEPRLKAREVVMKELLRAVTLE